MRNFIELTAEHLAGTHKSHGEKTLKPTQVFIGKNYRSNDEGGRYPRPGYEDSLVDLSSLAFTDGRGIHSSRTPKRLWFAGDDGSDVKILYVDTDPTGAQYNTPFDVGLTLTTAKYVEMMDWEGDIYYANGADNVGRIIVGQVATAVVAGVTSLVLKTGNGVRFPTAGGPYTARIGTDVFTYTTRTTDTLSGIPASGASAMIAHAVGEVVTLTTTYSPVYVDKASFLAEWLASLNLGGDPDNPRVWEFGKFANASDLTLFYDFAATPAGSELLGEGGAMTGFYAAKNFFFVFKDNGVYATAKSTVSTTTGARIPQRIKKTAGLPNPRCIVEIGEDLVAYYSTTKRVLLLRGRVEDGKTNVAVEDSFDTDIEKDLKNADEPGEKEWVTYNDNERLLKVCVLENGVRKVYSHDFNMKTANFGVWYDADTNKSYDVVTEHENLTWGFDGTANILFKDEFGNYDHDIPVDCEWETGLLGRDEFLLGKARELLLHGHMTENSVAYMDFYKGSEYQFTKKLDDSRITTRRLGTQIGAGGIGSTGFGAGGPGPTAYPFRWPIGANHKDERFKIKIRIPGDNGDFVQFDGYTLRIRPLHRYPYKRA